MGSKNAKPRENLKVNHSRTAGVQAAGTAIDDPTEWCRAFANDEDSYNQMKAAYESCDDNEKEQICELL